MEVGEGDELGYWVQYISTLARINATTNGISHDPHSAPGNGIIVRNPLFSALLRLG
jgi:hypothetical protein